MIIMGIFLKIEDERGLSISIDYDGYVSSAISVVNRMLGK